MNLLLIRTIKRGQTAVAKLAMLSAAAKQLEKPDARFHLESALHNVLQSQRILIYSADIYEDYSI